MLVGGFGIGYKRNIKDMDKSPKHPRVASPVLSSADLLLRAVQSVSAMRRSNVIIGAGDPAWTPPVIRVAHPERNRYGAGLHAHDKPEICIALDGKAAMEVAGKIHRFEPPCIAVLTPGTKHSELFVQRRSVYRLLWLDITGDSLLAMISCYRGEGQWELERVSPLQGPLVTRLRLACSRVDERAERAAEVVRAELLPVLSELHRFEVLGRVRQAEAGDGARGRVAQIVARARGFIDMHYTRPIDVAVVAELTAMSPNYLNTLFSRQVGMGIKAYLIKQRMDHAMKLCTTPGMMMKQIALAVGYQDPLYFSRVFRGYHGMTPTEARGRALG